MRVLTFVGPHQLQLEDRPVPEPRSGEIRIRVARVGICGSDLHGYTGESGRRIPGSVMGHEASGWIEALGPGVDHLKVGTPVTFNPAIPCDGACGHTASNRCAHLRLVGVAPELPGAFADAVVVPAERIVPIGSMSLELGATIEPMAVAVHAVSQVGASEGEAVAVIGGGMIGLCTAYALRDIGATPVVAEPMQRRRDLAARCGFHSVRPEDLPDLGPFDHSVDAVGLSATAAAALSVVPRGGSVGFVGLGTPELKLPLFEVVTMERVIVGCFGYSDDVFWETAARMADGLLDTTPLIEAVIPLEQAPEAFEALASGARSEVKILMQTGAETPRP